MTAARETLIATAQTVFDAYNSWSFDAIVAFRTDDCVQQILPASLGRPPVNNTEFEATLKPIMPAFRDWTLTMHDMVVDEVAGKVVMHVSSNAVTDIGPYDNEYILILTMTEDGTKVKKFVQFADSAYSKEYLGSLRAYMAKKAERAKAE
ncbi:hypothetical protein MMC25_000809 [Agyrium rufum]|nr:hypothetical protein [Agyrium rufum]